MEPSSVACLRNFCVSKSVKNSRSFLYLVNVEYRNTEGSCLQIRYQYDRKPMYHLLTMMCAIVGGVVTVAGVIDKILFSTHQLIKQKILLGKHS